MITFIDSDTIFRKIGTTKTFKDMILEIQSDISNNVGTGKNTKTLEFCQEVLVKLDKDSNPFDEGSEPRTPKIDTVTSKDTKVPESTKSKLDSGNKQCLLKCILTDNNVITKDGKYFCIKINRYLMSADMTCRPKECNLGRN